FMSNCHWVVHRLVFLGLKKYGAFCAGFPRLRSVPNGFPQSANILEAFPSFVRTLIFSGEAGGFVRHIWPPFHLSLVEYCAYFLLLLVCFCIADVPYNNPKILFLEGLTVSHIQTFYKQSAPIHALLMHFLNRSVSSPREFCCYHSS